MYFKIVMAGANYTHRIGQVYSKKEILADWRMEGSGWDGTVEHLNEIMRRDNKPEWWLYLVKA